MCPNQNDRDDMSALASASPAPGPNDPETLGPIALPRDPLACYALGLLRKLVVVARPSVECDELAMGLQVMVSQRLQDDATTAEHKTGIVRAIEAAMDLESLQLLLLELDAAFEAKRPLVVDDELVDTAAAGAPPLEEPVMTGALVAIPGTEHPIPEVLGCAICCDELMLKPATLLCGHSFCKRCLDMWLKSCTNCPTCRQPVIPPTRGGISRSTTSVNIALQELIMALYPARVYALEQQDHMERLDRLRELILCSIDSGQSIRELVARDQELNVGDGGDPQAAVTLLLDTDVALQEQVLAAEIRERLRKERALREASRRRHVLAYCHGVPASVVRSAPASSERNRHRDDDRPLPDVQSLRPTRRIDVTQLHTSKTSNFFSNLLRRKADDAHR